GQGDAGEWEGGQKQDRRWQGRVHPRPRRGGRPDPALGARQGVAWPSWVSGSFPEKLRPPGPLLPQSPVEDIDRASLLPGDDGSPVQGNDTGTHRTRPTETGDHHPLHQVPDLERSVVGGGDGVATVGCDSHCVHWPTVVAQALYLQPRIGVPKSQEVVRG